MAPLRGVLLLTLLAGSNAMRMASVDTNTASTESLFEHGTAATKKIHDYIKNMHNGEAHHVCVTGNVAPKFVDELLLKGTGSVRESITLESKLNPKKTCKADTAQVGNVVYSITTELEDACVPRWKLHTTSCDVLIHAHSGEDCDQLYKFRLTHENCDAQLIVVYDQPTMLTCYDGKMGNFAEQHQGAWCGHEEDPNQYIFSQQISEDNGQSVADKFTAALSKNAAEIKSMIEKAAGLDSTTSLIALLQNAKKHATKVINVAEELAQIQHAHGGDVKTALMQLSNRMKRGPGDDAAIVVDLGSGTLRAGFAGDEKPTASFANMVGYPKYDEVIVGVDNKDHYVGDEADAMRGVLKLEYPIQKGIVENYELLDLIWKHTFDNELRVQPQGKKIMITEPPLNPLHVRNKLATDLFEKYGVAGMYINNAAVLSIYAAGRSTGLAISSGDGVTHVVPVYEGYGLTDHIRRLDFGGAQINDWLKKLLAERGEFRGEDTETSAGREILRKIKETQCYVAFNEAMKDKPEYKDFEEELKKSEEIVNYELPDKTVIKLGKERFRCAEPLFDPTLIGRETSSIPQLIVDSIELCDMDVKNDLYNNICVSGGNTMFPGFAERLKKEVEKLRPAKAAVAIAAQPDRHIHTWIGGSILAHLDTFNDPDHPMWFTKSEYELDGIQVLEMKCPWQR